MPDGNSIQNQQWTNGTSLQNPQPPSNAVGGYTNPTGSAPPDTTGGCIVLIQGQSGSQGQNGACNVSPVNMEQQSFTFYWLAGGSGIQMTYYYTMTNGQTASATAAFNVTGPPSASITATPGITNVYPPGDAEAGAATTPWLEFGAAQIGNVGMSFNASVAPNSGAYEWVQILGSNSVRFRTSPSTASFSPFAAGGLDNFYPYPSLTSTSTNDSPGVQLDDSTGAHPSQGEAAETFQATMYLLWDPAIPPPGQNTCSPATTDPETLQSTASTCASIPVPVASVSWGWNGDTIKTLDPSQGGPGNSSWILHCGTGSPSPPGSCGTNSPPAVGPVVYPTWTVRDRNTM